MTNWRTNHRERIQLKEALKKLDQLGARVNDKLTGLPQKADITCKTQQRDTNAT